MATIDQLRRGISQYETGTGRRISPEALQALLQAQLQVESDTQSTNKALELRERGLESDIKARKAEAEAAKLSGITQLGGTAVQSGLLLKDTSVGKAITSGVSGLFGAGAATAGADVAAGTGLSLLGGTGAQALGATAAGTTATGAGGFSLLGGTGAEALGATTATAATGAGSTAALGTEAATGGFSGALGVAAPPLAGAAGGRFLASALFGGDSTAKDVGTIGGAAGIGFLVGGPVGAVIGAGVGVVGDFIADSVGTVICTELHRQGYIPGHILYFDSLHRVKNIDDQTYSGYLRWAEPTVRMMQKSRIVTQLIRPFGVAWAYEMAHRMNPNIKGNILGKVLLKVGIPVCSFLGEKEMKYGRA